MGIGAIMVGMTLVSLPLMDRTGRRTLHLYGLGGMFIFSIFITISFLIKVCLVFIDTFQKRQSDLPEEHAVLPACYKRRVFSYALLHRHFHAHSNLFSRYVTISM